MSPVSSTRLLVALHKRASGKAVLGLFLLTNAVYLAILLVTIPHVLSFAPQGVLFDMAPTGYSHSQAMRLLESLGPEGRQAYLFPQLTLDFVYPGLFGICYSLMFLWVYSKRVRSGSKLFYLALIPALAGLFDYGENILILRMIAKFPTVSDYLVAVASGFTLLKSAFTTVSFLLILLGFALLLKKPRPRSSQP